MENLEPGHEAIFHFAAVTVLVIKPEASNSMHASLLLMSTNTERLQGVPSAKIINYLEPPSLYIRVGLS
jgi:hypothetical protein